MRRFWQDVLDYVGGVFFLRAIGLVSFIYAGKLLPPAHFGYFAMASVVISVGSALAQFGASGLILRTFRLEGGRTLVRALPLMLVLWVAEAAALLAFGGVLAGMSDAFRAVADHPSLVSLLLLTATCNVLLACYLIASLRARTVAVATSVRSVAYLGSLVGLATVERSYLALLYATLAGDLAFIGCSVLRHWPAVAARLSELRSLSWRRTLVDQARGGSVFLSSDLMGLLQSQLVRIILSAYIPVAQLGVYAFFSGILSSLAQLPSAFQQAYTPRLIAAYQQSADRTGRLLCNLMPVWAIGLTVGYLAAVAAGELGFYRLAFRADYLPHVGLLNAMLFVVVCGAMLQTFYFSYYVGTRNAAIRAHAIVNLVAFVGLQLVLIPLDGLRGAVTSEVLASAVQMVSLFAINYRLLIVGWTRRAFETFLVFVASSTLVVVSVLLFELTWSALLYGLAGLALAYGLRALPQLQEVYESLCGRRQWMGIQSADLGKG